MLPVDGKETSDSDSTSERHLLSYDDSCNPSNFNNPFYPSINLNSSQLSDPTFAEVAFNAQLCRAISVASLLQSKSHWVSIQIVWLKDLKILAVTGERLELPDCSRSQTTLLIPIAASDAVPSIVLPGLASNQLNQLYNSSLLVSIPTSPHLDILFAFVDLYESVVFYRISLSNLFSEI